VSGAFVLRSTPHPEPPGKQRVLLTGAAGVIGRSFAEAWRERYDLRLMVRPGGTMVDALEEWGEVVACNLDDLPGLKRVFRDVDTVVHLAADSRQTAPWNSVLPNNIVGTYNVMTAAKAAGCRRVIFASSVHAVTGYPPGVHVQEDDPVNPGDVYGVGKCFGEAMGRYMAEQQGLSVIVVRIGGFETRAWARQEDSLRFLNYYVSPRDLEQLYRRCIDDRRIQFAIFHGLSATQFNKLDISLARNLVGYDPVDDLSVENPRLAPLDLPHRVSRENEQSSGTSGLRDDLPERQEP
jgi:NAD(P)-dependent dehydrogenase (short-subunit alcohol dehydrogenase family)